METKKSPREGSGWELTIEMLRRYSRALGARPRANSSGQWTIENRD